MVRPWCRLQRPSPTTMPVTATTSSISWSTAEHRITTSTTSSSLSSTVASWTRHASLHLARSSPPSHSLACRQRKGIREPSVQAVLLGNGHRSGVCDHQHGSAKWRVRARWPDPLQYGSLPSRRQWTPAEVVGEVMLTASYLCNRMPHFGPDMETPFKRLFGKEANLSACTWSSSFSLKWSNQMYRRVRRRPPSSAPARAATAIRCTRRQHTKNPK